MTAAQALQLSGTAPTMTVRERSHKSQIVRYFDRALLDLLKKGRIVTDRDGAPVLDDDGAPVRCPQLPASVLALIARRVDSIYRERVDQEQRARAAEQPQHGPPPGYEPPRRASK